MTEQPHHDQLREAFETYENNTPDPAVVYAQVQELSKKYKRRRRGAQIAAGGVIGAGLLAGAINLPSFLPGNSATLSPAAAPAVSASAPSADDVLQEQYDAYTDAGYGYDDAGRLAKLWKMSDDNRPAVKAEAGRRLLLGETLPITPKPDVPVEDDALTPAEVKQYGAFFGAGYVWADAEKLAAIWKLDDAPAAKIEAGKRLLAGQDLPIKPKKANVAAALETKRADAFFAKGYDVSDAVKLADLWNLKEPWQAKVEGGKRILAGQTLPIQP